MAGSVRLSIKAGMTNSGAIRKHVLLEIRLLNLVRVFKFATRIPRLFHFLCRWKQVSWFFAIVLGLAGMKLKPVRVINEQEGGVYFKAEE